MYIAYYYKTFFNYFCASERVWAEAELIEGPNPTEEINIFSKNYLLLYKDKDTVKLRVQLNKCFEHSRI